MADAVGIVNDQGPKNGKAFEGVVAKAPAEVQALARAVRELVYDVLPKTIEVVWARQGSVGWGTGPKKFTEQFAYMMAYKKHVTLGFNHGGGLSDPRAFCAPVGRR
jgi:hypothetical protein